MRAKLLPLLLIVMLLAAERLSAQLSGFVFGINNPSSGVFYFSKMDVSTGVFTQLQLMPWGGYNGLASSCIDNDHAFFYYCDGQQLFKIDPLTGAILSTIPLPGIGTGTLVAIRYNPCDSMIYGIVNNSPGSIYFARVDPAAGTLSNIGTLPNMGFMIGAMSFIDPVNQVYVLHQGGSLLGISLLSGQVAYNTTIVPLPNESFGHIAYDCPTGKIYGTSANMQEGLKYLGVLDPATGIVAHVSNASWPTGFWKPSNGGDCIDDSSGIYYYSGAGDLLVGVNIATGDTVSVHSTGAGSFLFVQCFSQCACTNVAVEESGTSAFSAFPNPATDVLMIQGPPEWSGASVVITDAAGHEVKRAPLNSGTTSVNIEWLAEGVYFWSIWSEERVQATSRFIKQ